jgi:hypothetical protein
MLEVIETILAIYVGVQFLDFAHTIKKDWNKAPKIKPKK